MTEEYPDPDVIIRAEIDRELIKEANRQGMSAEEVADLLQFALRYYGLNILAHPSFPRGVLTAYRSQ